MKFKWDKILTKEFLIEEYEVKNQFMKEIAKNVGCGLVTVYRYLIKHNIKLRSKKYYATKEARPNFHKDKNGKNNPFYGKHHTNETKKKLSIANKGKLIGKLSATYKDGRSLKQYYCKTCNIEISVNSGVYGNGQCLSCNATGRIMSENTRKKLSLMHRRDKHWNWQGGKSYEKYGRIWTAEFKEEIRKRDNHICRLCGKKQQDCKRKLDVHHIDYDKKNCNQDNLITLCRLCHLKTNRNREFWETVFSK